jgi:hypothetical protein
MKDLNSGGLLRAPAVNSRPWMENLLLEKCSLSTTHPFQLEHNSVTNNAAKRSLIVSKPILHMQHKRMRRHSSTLKVSFHLNFLHCLPPLAVPGITPSNKAAAKSSSNEGISSLEFAWGLSCLVAMGVCGKDNGLMCMNMALGDWACEKEMWEVGLPGLDLYQVEDNMKCHLA